MPYTCSCGFTTAFSSSAGPILHVPVLKIKKKSFETEFDIYWGGNENDFSLDAVD